jgi:CheY-like chemotaxis protein
MAQAGRDESGAGGQLSVLVVDDDPEMVDLVTSGLEAADGAIQTTGVTDPAAGLSALEETAFDGVVSDYHMPGMDGITFLTRVRECASAPTRVLVTSDDDAAVRQRAADADVTYLHKSSCIGELDQLLDCLTEERSA